MQTSHDGALKDAVRAFWETASCGEVYLAGSAPREQFETHTVARYALEPYIRAFAGFDGGAKDILEVGVGMGADHAEWAKSGPRTLVGIDVTPRAVAWTAQRLVCGGHDPHLMVADAEGMPFRDASFDLVYSWGVLHHTPNTQRCFDEVLRVLRPGGEALIMIYHRPSLVGYMLWARYGLASGHPRRSLADVYAHHLESPGTKGYTVDEGRALASEFSSATVRSQLGFGDLLQGEVGQQHRGRLLRVATRFWPRVLIKRALPNHGLMLLIRAVK
ncbi:MAG: class I SAM-dependent methyltransferase [Acidimicrobiales bacterium]